MNDDATVSESATGQNQPPPNRADRDASYSLGAGRKAVEVKIPRHHVKDDSEEEDDDDNDVPLSAPVGLALETQANEIDAER